MTLALNYHLNTSTGSFMKKTNYSNCESTLYGFKKHFLHRPSLWNVEPKANFEAKKIQKEQLRDQSAFVTWGGPEEFRGGGGGSLEIGLPKGGFTHLKILLREGSI